MRRLGTAARVMVTTLLFSAASVESRAKEFTGPVIHPGSVELVYLPQTEGQPHRIVRVAEKEFTVLDAVTPPSVHGAQLLEYAVINPGESVLDLGTGSGVQAVFAATRARRVVATDIDPLAVENARLNVGAHGLEKIVSVVEGDLFSPVKNEQFDVVLFNVSYPYDHKSLHLWKLHQRFFNEVGRHLASDGRIYYQAGKLDNIPVIRKMIENNGFKIEKLHMMSVPNRNLEPIVVVIKRQNS